MKVRIIVNYKIKLNKMLIIVNKIIKILNYKNFWFKNKRILKVP